MIAGKYIKILIPLIVLILVLGFFYPISASVRIDIIQLNDQIREKKEELDNLQKQINAYQKKIDEKQLEVISFQNQIKILENHIAKNELEIKEKELAIQTTQLEIEVLDVQINDLEQRIQNQKEILSDLIRYLNHLDQRSPLEMFLLNNTIGEFFDEIKKINDVQSNLYKTVNQVKNQKAELEIQSTERKEKIVHLRQIRQSLETETEQLRDSEKAKELLIVETRASEIRYRELLTALKREAILVDNELAELENRARSKLKEADKFLIGEVILTWPTISRVITSYFHDPDYPFRNIFEHPAIDIRVSQGTEIAAAAPGYVLRTRDGGMGYSYIILLHSNGFTTVYGHVSKILVQEDTFVERGEIIALSGGMPGTPGAGRLTTGPHLHFEVRREGIPVNPLNFLVETN